MKIRKGNLIKAFKLFVVSNAWCERDFFSGRTPDSILVQPCPERAKTSRNRDLCAVIYVTWRLKSYTGDS